MAYEISFRSEERVLVLRCHGLTDLEENERARREVLQLCQAKSIRKVLADFRDAETQGTTTTMDLYSFGKSWRYAGVGGHPMLACVLPREQESRQDVEFSATVGMNRGLYEALFNDFEEALNWLLERK